MILIMTFRRKFNYSNICFILRFQFFRAQKSILLFIAKYINREGFGIYF